MKSSTAARALVRLPPSASFQSRHQGVGANCATLRLSQVRRPSGFLLIVGTAVGRARKPALAFGDWGSTFAGRVPFSWSLRCLPPSGARRRAVSPPPLPSWIKANVICCRMCIAGRFCSSGFSASTAPPFRMDSSMCCSTAPRCTALSEWCRPRQTYRESTTPATYYYPNGRRSGRALTSSSALNAVSTSCKHAPRVSARTHGRTCGNGESNT